MTNPLQLLALTIPLPPSEGDFACATCRHCQRVEKYLDADPTTPRVACTRYLPDPRFGLAQPNLVGCGEWTASRSPTTLRSSE